MPLGANITDSLLFNALFYYEDYISENGVPENEFGILSFYVELTAWIFAMQGVISWDQYSSVRNALDTHGVYETIDDLIVSLSLFPQLFQSLPGLSPDQDGDH